MKHEILQTIANAAFFLLVVIENKYIDDSIVSLAEVIFAVIQGIIIFIKE